jgi:hypothetical protein
MSVRDPYARALRVCVLTSVFWVPAAGAAGQTVDHSQHGQHQPQAAGVLALPASREASGTSWLPDASPMFAVHGEYNDWELMGHGNAFLQYINEGSDRGDDQFGSVNWFMGMASRRVGEGRLALRGMFSLEPATVNGCGYPTLLASGEVCDGRPIVDRQHPHDLFMEIAAEYRRPLTETLGLQLYGGLAGEPALGPVAFPHRTSAMANPIAPLSHHWLDATHITHGVFTGGVFARQWKVEGSVFNGREPDDERWDFDFAQFDSFSGRVWYLPTDRIALQVSAGHLSEAEADAEGGPRVDVDRVTASASYEYPFREGSSSWASTVAWGRNSEEDESTSFFLAETNVTFDEQDAWYGRLEVGRKSAHDLDIHDVDAIYTLSKLQAGYTRYFDAWNGLKPGVGATLSMSLVPSALDTVYGNRSSFGFGLYVTLRPAAMTMR